MIFKKKEVPTNWAEWHEWSGQKLPDMIPAFNCGEHLYGPFGQEYIDGFIYQAPQKP